MAKGRKINKIENASRAEDNAKEDVIYSLLTDLGAIGCFKSKIDNAERRKIVKLIIKTIQDGSEGKLRSETRERLTALKSYKLITVRGKTIKLTKKGIEFLKYRNKEYYLGKLLLIDKYKRTKHPDIFIECFNQFVELPYNKRKSISSADGAEINYRNVWKNFVNGVYTRLQQKKPLKVVKNVCSTALRNKTVGTKAPMDMSVSTLKKILKELLQLGGELDGGKELRKIKGKTSFSIENMLEKHLEEIIRSNFKTIFPDLEIIDNNQQHYTIHRNLIDILCRNKKDRSYVVIELKR